MFTMSLTQGTCSAKLHLDLPTRLVLKERYILPYPQGGEVGEDINSRLVRCTETST